MMRPPTTAEALRLLLDQVDYTKGACGVAEPVGGVLSTEVLALCRQALEHAPHHREDEQ